jgi:phospholipase/carboxylesterase
MTIKKLEAVEINPSTPAKASVIWLHGLGADGHDFASIVPQLQLPKEVAVRFIFPHAPLRAVTLNQGYTMRAWFDIFALEVDAPIDTQGLHEMQQMINHLIAEEIARGIPTEKIVLAGFSQGGAMALYAGLLYPKRLAGILGLSTFFPITKQLTEEKTAANKITPIMLAHGEYDNVLPLAYGTLCRDELSALGYNVSWHQYPMQHNVCAEEIKDIAAWLIKVFA